MCLCVNLAVGRRRDEGELSGIGWVGLPTAPVPSRQKFSQATPIHHTAAPLCVVPLPFFHLFSLTLSPSTPFLTFIPSTLSPSTPSLPFFPASLSPSTSSLPFFPSSLPLLHPPDFYSLLSFSFYTSPAFYSLLFFPFLHNPLPFCSFFSISPSPTHFVMPFP